MGNGLESAQRKEMPSEIARIVGLIVEDLPIGIRVNADYDNCIMDPRKSRPIKSIPNGTDFSEGSVCVNDVKVKGVSARNVAVFLVTHCFMIGKNTDGKEEEVLRVNYDVGRSFKREDITLHLSEENVKWLEEKGGEYVKLKFDLHKSQKEAIAKSKETLKNLLKEAKRLGIIKLNDWDKALIKSGKGMGMLKSEEEWPEACVSIGGWETHLKTIENSKDNKSLMEAYLPYWRANNEIRLLGLKSQELNNMWERDFVDTVFGKEIHALHDRMFPKIRDAAKKPDANKVR